ncbi:MAG: c-type cytochrome domain-containing protein, partial [Planctomycetota bacterium]|nr:c-type cytochrome domain-containing protein [Planctomycetota bacterium]
MFVNDKSQSDVQRDSRCQRPHRRKQWIGTWLLVLLTPVAAFAWQDTERLQTQLNREFHPLLQEYCGDCHSGTDAEGGLDLVQVQRIDQLLRDAKRWQRLKDRVRRGQMPPPDAEPLPEEEKKRFLDWLEKSLKSLDCTDVNPGNVSIRRLNRT